MVFLALLAALLGVGAPAAVKYISVAAGCVIGMQGPGITLSASLNTVIIASTIFAASAAAFYFMRPKRVTEYNTWSCGYYKLTPRTEYSATAFSKPLRIAFGFFLLPYSKTEKIRDSFYHVRSFKYEVFTTPVFRNYIYDPVVNLVFMAARQVKKIQPAASMFTWLIYSSPS
jgi:hydrogenase-4 component B